MSFQQRRKAPTDLSSTCLFLLYDLASSEKIVRRVLLLDAIRSKGICLGFFEGSRLWCDADHRLIEATAATGLDTTAHDSA